MKRETEQEPPQEQPAEKDDSLKSLTFSCSSEEPYERWWGIEILGHSPEEVVLDRLKSAAPLLLNHDSDELIGVVDDVWIENQRLMVKVTFSRNKDAQEVYTDIVDGIRKNVSIGYAIYDMREIEMKDEIPIIRATKWEPYEVSFVSMPADTSIGIGRSFDTNNNSDNLNRKASAMEPIQKTEEELRKLESDRVAEIELLAKDHNIPADVTKAAILNKQPIEFFRGVCLGYMDRAKPLYNDRGGIPKEDLGKFNISRALQAILTGQESDETKMSDILAKEYGNEFRIRGKVANKVPLYVPVGLSKRDLTFGGAGIGAEWGGVDFKSDMFIDLLQSKQVLAKAGSPLYTGLKGTVQIPKVTGGMNLSWPGETGSGTESTPVTAQLTMAPKRFTTFIDISGTLIDGSPMATEAIVSKLLWSKIGLGLEKAALEGATGTAPTGLAATTGVLTDVSLASVTWKKIVDFYTQVESNDGDTGNMNWIMKPSNYGVLEYTPKVANYPVFMADSSKIAGNNVLKTNNVTAGKVFFGSFEYLIQGMWGVIQILVDPYTLSKDGLVSLVVNGRADVGVMYPEGFAYKDDFSA